MSEKAHNGFVPPEARELARTAFAETQFLPLIDLWKTARIPAPKHLEACPPNLFHASLCFDGLNEPYAGSVHIDGSRLNVQVPTSATFPVRVEGLQNPEVPIAWKNGKGCDPITELVSAAKYQNGEQPQIRPTSGVWHRSSHTFFEDRKNGDQTQKQYGDHKVTHAIRVGLLDASVRAGDAFFVNGEMAYVLTYIPLLDGSFQKLMIEIYPVAHEAAQAQRENLDPRIQKYVRF